MNRSQLAQATALFWRHLRPALTDPAKFVGLVQRIGQIWASKGITGAIKHHAPGAALYADYTQWLVEREPAKILKLDEGANAQTSTPIVSVLFLSDANTTAEFPALLKSLLAQNSAAWELMVDARLWEHHTNPNHPQIRSVEVPDVNVGIALEKLAKSSAARYIHIYQDGVFRVDWVRQCAHALDGSSPKLLYWDHDLIDAQQMRHAPNFKPRWNPELMLSQNYIGAAWLTNRDELLHLLSTLPESIIVADSMPEEVRILGVFSPFYYRLLLEIAFSNKANITHLAQTLSHHREPPKLAALISPLNAFLGAHKIGFSRAQMSNSDNESDSAIALTPSNHATPRVSIIIPTRDGLGLLQHTISSLQAITGYKNYEIIIADNDSTDPATCAYLNEVNGSNNIRVIKTPGVFNFSKINNIATEHTEGELLLFLNNDVEIIESNWLTEMVGNAINTGVGAVGCMLLFPNRTIQHAGIVLGLGGYAKHVFANQPEGYVGPNGRACSLQQLSAVTAACLMVQRQHFNAVNGFDERYAVAFNDVDLCLRLSAAGLRNIWTPNAVLLHHESASRGYDDSAASQSRFLAEAQQFHARWDHQLRSDPFYNPNLTLTGAGFALNWDAENDAAVDHNAST